MPSLFRSIVRLSPVRYSLRRSRRQLFRLLGRAPVCNDLECVSNQRDRSIVAALRRSEQFTPMLVRKEGDLEFWKTVAGDLWTPRMTIDLVRKLTGEAEYDAYDLAGAAARVKGGVILDCGANIGLFARAALKLGAAQVICFEPTPLTIEALRRNLADAIADGRAVIVPAAIASAPGRAEFQLVDGDCGSNRIGASGAHPTIVVEVKSIDSYVAERGLDRVDFIKMDIEGAEADATSGAAETLRRFVPIFAVATEHTIDVLKNTQMVLAAMPENYRGHCLECHAERSPVSGFVLTPYVVQLRPSGNIHLNPNMRHPE
jgi:FkbM family methyltransferase